MGFKEKAVVLNEKEVKRIITRIAHEIIEKNKGTENLVIVGIRTRGVFLAERVAQNIEKIERVKIPVGVLDITLYRDDLTTIDYQPVIHSTEIPFDITGKKVILVDDVLYTGRTIRAALDALIDFGRPKAIQLAVLIDRGYRELPIRPDYVGETLSTTQREVAEVRMKEIDGLDSVVVKEEE